MPSIVVRGEDGDDPDRGAGDRPAGGVPPEPPDTGETVSLGSYASGGTRYRLIRPIGRGGIGEVWLARDLELNRDVALKQLLGKHAASEDFKKAFLREIRAGAVLEHPGIIPIYDIGQHPDGRLFGVMRYFGESDFNTLIRDYHRDHPGEVADIPFRALLGHFVAACRAIAYAHAREVIHLDIKPANVITGPFGETQVIDWGMAWLKGQAIWEQVAESSGGISGGGSASGGSGVPDMTKPRGFKGTPAYAAPEQHRQKWDAINARTDVYGLGATLHFLLACAPPFDIRQDTFHADVLAGHRHSEPKPWAPRALAAIAAKAMAPDPKARYASAAELADDVDRFLADEPVKAFPDPPSVRAWRFVKRHRALAAAAAALLLTSAAALGIGVVAVSKERDEARRQAELAREAEAEAERQRDLAEQAADEARRQERLARDNAAATRRVIAGFIESVADDAWAEVPGTAELRLEAVRKVLEEYPQLIAQQPDDRDLRYDAATLDRRCANLFRTLGRLEDAKQLYDRSRDKLDALLAGDPEDGRSLLGRAELLADVGELQLRTGGPDRALATYREAVRDAAAGRATSPDPSKGSPTLARVRMDLADALLQGGDATEAATLARGAVEGFDAVIARDADADEETRVVTRLLASLASSVAARASAETGDRETALSMARAADRRSAELSARYGGVPDVDFVRGEALRSLGSVLSRDAGTRTEGEEAAEYALDLLRGVVAGDGDVANFRPALAEMLCDRAERLVDAGVEACGLEVADEAIAVIEPLDAPGDAFEAKRHLARARALRGRAAKSREDLLLARADYDAVVTAAPRNEKLREEAAVVERLLAE